MQFGVLTAEIPAASMAALWRGAEPLALRMGAPIPRLSPPVARRRVSNRAALSGMGVTKAHSSLQREGGLYSNPRGKSIAHIDPGRKIAFFRFCRAFMWNVQDKPGGKLFSAHP